MVQEDFFKGTDRSDGVEQEPAGRSPGLFQQADRSMEERHLVSVTPRTYSEESHRLRPRRFFHLYREGRPELQLFSGGGRDKGLILGTELHGGQHPQFVVPSEVWQGSRLEPGSRNSPFWVRRWPLDSKYADSRTGPAF